MEYHLEILSEVFLMSTVTFNFMSQLDWVIGYSAIWSNIILGVPVRILSEINI